MLKISRIVKHTTVHMAGCAKTASGNCCPVILDR